MFFLDTIKGHVTISQHLQSHLIFMNIAIFSEVESTTVQRKYANTHHFQK
jgi:hypothetical protein